MNPRIEALTAQLTKMTPQQRQQFAAQHKSDPIVVGLAKFVNDQEGALRNALNGPKNAAALAPQPTVVDQEIAGMAGLPRAAAVNPPPGGITGETSLPPQAPPQQAFAGGGKVDPMLGNPMGGDMGSLPYDTQDEDTGPGIFELMRRRFVHPTAAPQPAPVAAQVPKIGGRENGGTPMAAPGAQPAAAPISNPYDDILRQLQAGPPAKETSESVQVSGGGGGGGAGIASLAARRPNVAASDIQGQYAQFYGSQPKDAVAKDEINTLTSQRQAAADANTKELEDRIAARGEVGKGYEERLRKKDAKLDEEEHNNAGLALLDAGLAMMAGESPHAMVNIGKGAQQGLKSFKEGKDKIEAGRDKVAEGLFALEKMRRGETMENDKALMEAHSKARDVVSQGTEMMIKGIMEREKVNRETATAMLKSSVDDANSRRSAEASMYGHEVSANATLGAAGIHAGATKYAANLRNSADKQQLGYQKLQLAAQIAKDKAEMATAGAGLSRQRAADAAFANAIKGDPLMEPSAKARLKAEIYQQYGVESSSTAAPQVDTTGFKVLR